MIRVLILFIVFALVSTTVGEAISSLFKLEKVKHKSIYGVFSYLMGFFIISCFAIITGRSWDFFSTVITIYSLILIGTSVFQNYRQKKNVKMKWETSFTKIKEYVYENTHLYILIGIFSVLTLFSLATIYFNYTTLGEILATTDEHYYVSKAAEFIGSSNLNYLFQNIESGQTGGFDLQMINAYYELFWSFCVTTFGIDLLILTHTVFPILVYWVTFLILDEMLYLTTGDNYKKVRFSLYALLFMYLINGMQFEYAKLMYLPWYGNVIVTILYIPLALIFIQHSLKHRGMLLYFLLLPFFMAGFNLGAVAATLFIYPPAIVYWWKNRVYAKSSDRYIFVLLMMVLLLFIGATIVQLGIYMEDRAPSIQLFRSLSDQSEYGLFRGVLSIRLFLLMPGALWLIYAVLNKKITVFEQYFVLYTFVILGVLVFRPIGELVTGLAGFGLRRVLEGAMLYLIIYSAVVCLKLLPQRTMLMNGVLAIIVVGVAIFNYGGYINHKRFLFSKEAVQNPERLHTSALKLYKYLQNDTETRYICEASARIPVNIGSHKIEEELYVDFQLVIAADRETKYVGCDLLPEETTRFYLANVDDFEKMQVYGITSEQEIARFTSDQLTVGLFEVVKSS